MNEVSLTDLVGPLTRATEAGTVQWEVREDQYATIVGSNKVALWKDGAGISMAVHDRTNKIIEYYLFSKNDVPAFGDVSALFWLIDRRVRNVDGVLTDILHQLEAATTAHG